jgi:hypothetical protein
MGCFYAQQLLFPVALLEFFSAPAPAWIIPADFPVLLGILNLDILDRDLV